MSFVVAYLDLSNNTQLGCVHHFYRVCKREEEYLLAAIAPLKGITAESPQRHPIYRIPYSTEWPPREFPTVIIRAESILYKCLVVRIKGEVENGRAVAHVLGYIHKTCPEPRWWTQTTGDV